MGAEVLVPEVRLAASNTSTAGDARVTLGPAAVRELGVQLGDPVAVDVRWERKLGESGGGEVGSGGGDGVGTAAAAPDDDGDEWTWTFLVRASCYPVSHVLLSLTAFHSAFGVSHAPPERCRSCAQQPTHSMFLRFSLSAAAVGAQNRRLVSSSRLAESRHSCPPSVCFLCAGNRGARFCAAGERGGGGDGVGGRGGCA